MGPMFVVCVHPDCAGKPIARGMCPQHYQQWKRATPPADRTLSPREAETDQDRFARHVNRAGPIAKRHPELGRCHLWTGGTCRGYGIFSMGNRSHRAHIVAFEWENGPVPDGLVLDHFACDRPSCVNPVHVRPTTHRVNILNAPDGLAARNAAKTVCDSGHDYTETNTYIDRQGKRSCKECRRIADREAKSRQRAAAKAAGMKVRDYLALQRAAKRAARI